jgi:glycosyltransferase involved in cell wall biosynthesis
MTREAVASALAQEGVNLEVLVLDDGSPTDQMRFVEEFVQDPRVQFERWATNRGAAVSWNALLERSIGHFVKVLPQDDRIAAGALTEQCAALRVGGIALAAGRRRLMTRSGRPAGPPFGLRALTGTRRLEAVLTMMARTGGNPVGEPGSLLTHRELAREVGFSPGHGYAIDLGFIIGLLRQGDLHGFRSVHAFFRVSNDAWTARLVDQQTDDFMRLFDEAVHGLEEFQSRRVAVERTARRRSRYRRTAYRLLGGMPDDKRAKRG